MQIVKGVYLSKKTLSKNGETWSGAPAEIALLQNNIGNISFVHRGSDGTIDISFTGKDGMRRGNVVLTSDVAARPHQEKPELSAISSQTSKPSTPDLRDFGFMTADQWHQNEQLREQATQVAEIIKDFKMFLDPNQVDWVAPDVVSVQDDTLAIRTLNNSIQKIPSAAMPAIIEKMKPLGLDSPKKIAEFLCKARKEISDHL